MIWASGVTASPLGRLLAEKTGAGTDKLWRVIVSSDLTIPDRPEIFIVGDLGHCEGKNKSPMPGLAPGNLKKQGT